MLDEVAVNGYMIDPFFASSVAANMKANDNVMFYNSELSENGISTIKTLSFKIVILNNDFVTIVQSDTITLNV